MNNEKTIVYRVVSIHANKQFRSAPFIEMEHAISWAEILIDCDRIWGRQPQSYAIQLEKDGHVTVIKIMEA